ncbi:MAG: hypothetical protein KF830_12375 [Planctomycetes bacterium]|nr:hypothetical protein [Planctomycetota bacterium]
MKKNLRPLLASAVLALLAGCVGQTYRVEVGAMFAKARGDIALQNSSPTPPPLEQNDLESNLGLGNTEVSPYVRIESDYERHRMRLHGFGIDASGSGTLAGAYGDLPAGTQVTTSLEFLGVGATWAWQLLREQHYRIAVGAALNYYSLDVAARSAGGREAVETSVLVPMPYAEVEGYLGPLVAGANAGVMSADLGDGKGRYLDIEAYLRWQATEQFDVLAGYRYVALDSYGRASSRDFDADVEIQGFFFGGGVKF